MNISRGGGRRLVMYLYKPAILLGDKYCIIYTFNYLKNLSGKLKYVCTRCVPVAIKSISNHGCQPKENIFSTAFKHG